MSIQPYLIMRHKSSDHSQVAVFKDYNKQLVQVGDDFSTIEYNITRNHNFEQGRVIHWHNALYAVAYDRIWKYVNESGDWNPIYQFPNFSSSYANVHLGLYPILVSGNIPLLICSYTRSDGDIHFVKIHTGADGQDAIWQSQEYDFTVGVGSETCMRSAVTWRDNLCFLFDSLPQSALTLIIYNPTIENLIETNVIDGDSAVYGGDLIVRNNRLYLAAYSPGFSNKTLKLWRIIAATTHSELYDYDNSNTENLGINVHAARAWVLNDAIYILGYISAPSYTWKLYKTVLTDADTIDSVTDLTSAVLPSKFRAGGTEAAAGVASNNTTHWTRKMDNVSNNGVGAPTIYLQYTRGAAGDSRELYQFIDDSTPLSLIDAGEDGQRYTECDDICGGGHRIWPGSGVLNISAPTLTMNGPDVEIGFRLFGNNEYVAVGFSYNLGSDSISNHCTLKYTSHGSISGLNDEFIKSVQADNTTLYTVTWDAASDGLEAGYNPRVGGRIFIPPGYTGP